MTITVAQLTTLRCASPAVWAPLLSKAVADNAIRNTVDWLANMMHECNRFATLRESLNYDVAGLLRTFSNHFSAASAGVYGRIGPAANPQRAADQWGIAERAYGGRMGNRPSGYGDGWNFRGTGPLMVTGRDNVAAFGKAIGWTGTLEALADQLAVPAFGAAAAGQFWRARGCDALTDPAAIRIRVNGGVTGIADVLAIRVEVARVLGVTPARPVPPARSAADDSADELNAASLELERNA